MKVKVIPLPYIFQVLYVLCFTRPRYQVSVYRTIGPLVEEPNFKIYLCVKGDIDLPVAEVKITSHTQISRDIGLFKHQLLFYYFSASSVWLILSKREGLSF